MNESDKQALGRKLAVIRAAHDKGPFSQAVIEDWMHQLQHVPWLDVERAIDEHRRHSPHVPQPSDVLAILRANDGHVGPQEAWLIGKVLTDEMASAWANDEIILAANKAKQVIDDDPIAARKIFLECYEREVAKARNEGRVAKWYVSEGWDYEGRKAALRDALEKKRITREIVKAKMPEILHDGHRDNLLMDGVVKLLGESKRMQTSEEDRKEKAQKLKELFADLKQKLVEG